MTSEIALLLVLILAGCAHAPLPWPLPSALSCPCCSPIAKACIVFVRTQLSEHEIRDGLILATAALVIMPLVDRFIGPFAAINLRTVLMMTVDTAGHVAMRLVGTRYGLAITSIASGSASSAGIAVFVKNPLSRCRPVPR